MPKPARKSYAIGGLTATSPAYRMSGCSLRFSPLRARQTTSLRSGLWRIQERRSEF